MSDDAPILKRDAELRALIDHPDDDLLNRGACRGRDTDDYFPDVGQPAPSALELCRSAENNFGIAGLLDLFGTRIRAFRESAPPADWAGVFVAETK